MRYAAIGLAARQHATIGTLGWTPRDPAAMMNNPPAPVDGYYILRGNGYCVGDEAGNGRIIGRRDDGEDIYSNWASFTDHMPDLDLWTKLAQRHRIIWNTGLPSNAEGFSRLREFCERVPVEAVSFDVIGQNPSLAASLACRIVMQAGRIAIVEPAPLAGPVPRFPDERPGWLTDEMGQLALASRFRTLARRKCLPTKAPCWVWFNNNDDGDSPYHADEAAYWERELGRVIQPYATLGVAP